MQMVSSRTAQASVSAHRLDRHGARRPPRRRLRHDADADIAFDQPADRVEAAQLHAQPQRLPAARRLVGEEALQGARAVEADEIVVEHLARRRSSSAWRADDRAPTTSTKRSLAERIGLERADVDGAGDDAEIGDPFGDQADDLVAQPLLAGRR